MHLKTHKLIFLSALLLTACQTVEQFSIDYMMPADVSFPAALKRVAVVNNVAAPLNPPKGGNPDAIISPPLGGSEGGLGGGLEGASSITAESLAESLAAENYFDEVVICDSMLRAADSIPRAAALSQAEVQSLTESLDVDFLIALEEIRINAVRKMEYRPDWNIYLGTTDVKVYPTIRIYLPGRKSPIMTVNATDSIFWEEAGTSEASVLRRLVSNEEMVEQASEFAGTVPMKHLLPSWKSANRYLFTGGCVDMRDAAVYAKERQWDKAVELWKRTYDTKKGKQKMYAAYNAALGYEMQDSIPAAVEWAERAQVLADGQTKDPTYRVFFGMYVEELQKRAAGLPRLNMQMERLTSD